MTNFTPEALAAINRLATLYNGRSYDAASNPGGFANDGHSVNFEPCLRDLATVGTAVAAEGGEVRTLAEQVSAGAVAALGAVGTVTEARDEAVAAAQDAIYAVGGVRVTVEDATPGPLAGKVIGGVVIEEEGVQKLQVSAVSVGAVPAAAMGDFADLEELAAAVRLQV